MILPDNLCSLQANSACDSSLRQVFEKSYSGLVYFSRSIIRDEFHAEDIVQDAMVNYWLTRHQVSLDIVAIRRFLYTTVRNQSLNYLKHKKVVHKFQERWSFGEMEQDSVESQIITSEVWAIIYRIIDTLPTNCRRVSRLSYVEGKKNQEIAQMLGVSVNTVKTHKQRAIQLLKRKLSVA